MIFYWFKIFPTSMELPVLEKGVSVFDPDYRYEDAGKVLAFDSAAAQKTFEEARFEYVALRSIFTPWIVGALLCFPFGIVADLRADTGNGKVVTLARRLGLNTRVVYWTGLCLTIALFIGALVWIRPPVPVGAVVFAVVIPFLFVFGLPLFFIFMEFAKEHPLFRNLAIFGQGGSARFGSVYSFLKYDFTGVVERVRGSKKGAGVNWPQGESASMLLGETLSSTDPQLGRRPIGLDSEAHMITVAMTGGGKSVYSAWNVLPLWCGGAFVLDPKGEHCVQTMEDRTRYGKCHVMDFWESTSIAERASYNPLDAIDINDPNAREDLNQIVSACLPDEKDESANSAHFKENARIVMMGYIVHVLSTQEKEHHNLPAVYDTILTGSPDGFASGAPVGEKNPPSELLIDAMEVNDAVGKVPMSAAKLLRDSGDNEGGGYKNTVLKGLEWASGKRFRQYLTKSSFSMRDIQNRRETVYFVISIDDIKEYSRFVKIIVNQGFLACREDAPHDKRTLFLLDEFAQLETFKSAKEGLVTLRSRGVKLWLHNQHLGQLKESYGDVDAFLGQCDLQVFAVNDSTTAEAVSKRLGEYTDSRTEKVYALRPPSEVMEDLRKGSKVQYVIPADGAPMRLRLVPFSKRFKDRTGYKKST